MSEPATIKERMEALGWCFEADFDPDGEKLLAHAIKLRAIEGRPGHSDVIAYHNETIYREDHAACRAAWVAEWDEESKPKTEASQS